MVLTGYGLDIRVNSGRLKIKDGSLLEGTVSETYLNRGTNEVEHLVILGQTGSISFEAIKWITDQNMMVSMMDPDGHLITSLMTESHISGIIKRRQATVDINTNLAIASWLLAEKLKGQRDTLVWLRDTFKRTDWLNVDRENRFEEAIDLLFEREVRLSSCSNVDAQRMLEAQCAAAYWHCFEGIPIAWSKPFKIPLNWLTIGNRTSPKTKSSRKAIDPFHASLNYLYTVLETKTRQTCFINNIDPDFGVIHVDHGSRNSLVFDLMEPVRPKLDRILFNWIYEQTFHIKDFFETREGVCRVSQDIISEIIPLTVKLDSDINAVIKQFAGFFKTKTVRQMPDHLPKKQKYNSKKNIKPSATQIILPFDVLSKTSEKPTKPNSTEISPGYIRCLECGLEFKPQTKTQKFCSNKHRNTHHMRLKRDKRISEGLCPLCGKPMQVAAKGTMKERLTYCSECRDYWKKS